MNEVLHAPGCEGNTTEKMPPKGLQGRLSILLLPEETCEGAGMQRRGKSWARLAIKDDDNSVFHSGG